MEPKVDDSNDLFEAFSSLRRVQNLILYDATIKALYREGSMNARLDHLLNLDMGFSCFSDDIVPALFSLLRGMPNLCSLYIGYVPNFHYPISDAYGFNMEYWKQQNLDFIHQLEEVSIELSDGSDGIEFARYILEHAETLEEMVVIYLPEQSDDIQKLNESKIKSNIAAVSFEEKQEVKQRKLF